MVGSLNSGLQELQQKSTDMQLAFENIIETKENEFNSLGKINRELQEQLEKRESQLRKYS